MLPTLRVLAATTSHRTERLALEALRLRRFARAVLRERSSEPGHAVSIPEASPEAWDLFLLAERCALPLHGRLQRVGLLDSVPPAARVVLDRARSEEIRRVLAAQSQIATLATIAAELGTSAILLKGGVAATTADPLDLNDLDVLLPPDRTSDFAASLDRRGFTASGVGSLYHLPPRRAPGQLTVEVHHGMQAVEPELVREWWTRARPLGTPPALLRLAPPDHLWSLLVHVAIQHPYRVGLLRDGMLIGAAAGECSAEELEVVRRRIQSHPEAAFIRPVLEDAMEGKEGDADRFAGRAAVRYATARAIFFSSPRIPDRRLWLPLLKVSTALSTSPGTYFEEWPRVMEPIRVTPGPREPGARAKRRPGLPRVLIRALRLFFLTLPALLLGRSARRALRREEVEERRR